MSGYGYILRCEVQNDTGRLPDLAWSQGATPRIVATPTRGGELVGADAETVARMMIAPTPTSELWAVVESAATEGGGYVLQWPTVGAHTTPEEPWFYTIYFMRDGKRYWTGSGRLFIEETSATGDGLVWQEVATWEDMVGEVVDAVENKDFDRLTLNGETITQWPQGGSGGVQSVNGKSGAVTLTPGAGISITETQGEGANGVTIENTREDPAGNYVPLETDRYNSKTAITIGSKGSGDVGSNSARFGASAVASGNGTLAHGQRVNASGSYASVDGVDATASGRYAHACGDRVGASGDYSHASGVMANSTHEYSVVWNGDKTKLQRYASHANGTCNFNPVGGAAGFYIGEDTLADLLSGAGGGGAETARVVTTASATVEDGDGLILMDTETAGQAQTLTLPATMEADAMTVTVRQLGDYGVTIEHGANEYRLTYAGDWVTLDWVSGKGWFWRA